MKITVNNVKIEDDGCEVLCIEKFVLVLKSNIFSGVSDVIKNSKIEDFVVPSQKENK